MEPGPPPRNMMPSVSLPVTRPSGTTLLIASLSARPAVMALIEPMHFSCEAVDNVYAAMVRLCRCKSGFGSLILSLSSCYREELAFVSSVKKRFPAVEIWLTQIDGRHAALIEAMRLGADGLLSEDGLHRIGVQTPVEPAVVRRVNPTAEESVTTIESSSLDGFYDHDLAMGEPVLSADELRALLHEQPGQPPVHES